MFDTLQDRLAATFKNLRGKGRLSEADIDATAREIRIALLEADVNLSVVKDFIAAIKEQARATQLSGALNPAQQVIKIVNDELVAILGGETRVLRYRQATPDHDHARRSAGLGQDDTGRQTRVVAEGAGPLAAAGGSRPAAAECSEPAAGGRPTSRRSRFCA